MLERVEFGSRAFAAVEPGWSGPAKRESPDEDGSRRWVIPLRGEQGPIPAERPRREPDDAWGLFQRIRRCKVAEWVVAYLALALIGLDVVDGLADVWGWSLPLQRGITVVLALGIFPAGVLAWYHGEPGRQGICLAECVILAGLLVASVLLVWRVVP